MKTISLTLLWIWCLAYMAFADRVKNIAWDANPETDIVGYHLFVNGVKQPRVIGTTMTITIPDTETVITALAVNTAGIEGPQSSALIIPAVPPPPTAPTGLRVVLIEDSSNLKDWKPVAMIPLVTDDPARFVRASITTTPTPE